MAGSILAAPLARLRANASSCRIIESVFPWSRRPHREMDRLGRRPLECRRPRRVVPAVCISSRMGSESTFSTRQAETSNSHTLKIFVQSAKLQSKLAAGV
jgi:hypothetical protein